MATISALRTALVAPIEHFRTLTNIVWDSATPMLRSTSFAESEAMIDGKRVRIMMPLTQQALRSVEQIIPLKLHLQTPLIPSLTILRDEMCVGQGIATGRYCDILLEPIVEGIPFDEALAHAATDEEFAAELVAALDKLQAALREADISHNNLREENLILDDNNTLRPQRWYYATRGAGGDDSHLTAMRNKLAAMLSDMPHAQQAAAAYNLVAKALAGYLNHQPMSEGLIAVENEQGWGFIDCNGREVIAHRYDWAGAFCEGRAEVKTGYKMGLIDKRGKYIIEPTYDIVDYDHISGNSAVKSGDGWAIFNYSGEQVTEFGKDRPNF